MGTRSKFFITGHLSENIKKTPEGYLLCIGVSIARTGEMEYSAGETPLDVGENGKVIVTREAEEVFRAETMASFEGKAVTILHPMDFVSPENWSTLSKGAAQNVRRGAGAQENDLVADLLIMDAAAIAAVEEGLREVSCGYEAEYMQTGVGRGIQKNIIGNHIALVTEGRAGSAYAINDSKGKGSKMKLSERIKSIFAKAQDEALKAADENTETPEKKDGFVSKDDYEKGMKAIGDKIDAMAPKKEDGKDAETKPTQNEPAKMEEGKDDDADPMAALAARLEKVEGALAKLLENKAADADGEESEESEDDDMEESEDADCEDAEEGEEKKDGKTGDAVSDLASRVEILAPGLKASTKDVKVKALVAAYATTDGKAIIEKFTGGKAPDYKNAILVESLFVGASELLKVKRTSDFAGTKTQDFKTPSTKGEPTPEEINAANAKHYGSK